MLDNAAPATATPEPSAPPPEAPTSDPSASEAAEIDAMWSRMESGGPLTDPDADKGGADEPAANDEPRVRNERGQFAANPKAENADKKPTDSDKAATDGDERAEAEADNAPATALRPPNAFAALKDEWSKLPEAVQGRIVAREREINDGFSRLGRQLKAYEPIGQVLEHHGDLLERANIAAPNLIHGLFNQFRALNTNPDQTIAALVKEYNVDPIAIAVGNDPVAAIQRIAQQHRIDLLDLAAGTAPAQPQSAADPRYDALQQKLEAVEAENRRITEYMSGREREARSYQERQEQARVDSYLAAINPVIDRTSDWETIRPRVHALLPVVMAENPDAPPDRVMAIAIEDARRADRKAFEKMTSEQAARAAKAQIVNMTERAGKAKAATAANVKGAASPAAAALSEEDEINAAWSKLMRA